MSIKFISLKNDLEPNFKRIKFNLDNSKENNIEYCNDSSNPEVKAISSSSNNDSNNNSNNNLKKRLIGQESDYTIADNNPITNKFNIDQYPTQSSLIPKSTISTTKKLKFDSSLITDKQKCMKSNFASFDKVIDCNYLELIDYWFPNRSIGDENFLS